MSELGLPTKPSEVRAPRSLEMGSAKKVLVVDDNPLFADGLAAILEIRGYKVACCYAGRDCIEKAVSFKPDVIISDHVMGDMTGLEVLKSIREHPDLPSIPFIVVTGFQTRSLREEFEAAGARVVISKSDVSDRLLDAVEDLLRGMGGASTAGDLPS